MTDSAKSFRGKVTGNFGQKRALARVDGVLANVIANLGLDLRLREHTLLNLWPDLVGDHFARKTRALFIDNEHRLVVSVADAPTGQEMSLLKSQVLAKLRAAASGLGLSISGLRFDLKHFYRQALDQGHSEACPEPLLEKPNWDALSAVSLNEQERKELDSITDSALPGPLAQRVRQVMELKMREQRWMQSRSYPQCATCRTTAARLHGRRGLCPTCFLGSLTPPAVDR